MIDAVSFLSRFCQKRFSYILITLLVNLAAIFYYYYFFTKNSYLPSPFLADKSDTFMDFYNPMYWAYESGRYTEWGSVYPPLNFLILKIISFFFDGSRYGDPSLIRENSSFVTFGFGLTYLLGLALVLKTKIWKDFTVNEKSLIYFSMIFSTPLLFALERGNLILLVPLLLATALSEIAFLRALSIALLINFKPYFALLLFYYIFRKNLKGFLSCMIIAGFIFILSGLELDKNFLDFFVNLFSFSKDDALFSLRDLMAMPSSVSAFSYALNNQDGAAFVAEFLGSMMFTLIANVIEVAKWSVLTFSLAILAVRSRLVSDAEILSILVVVICNLGIWVGGYTFVLYITLIPIFIKMRKKHLYIAFLTLIEMPLDLVPLFSAFIGEQYSYLSDANVNVHWVLGLGSVVRPILNLVLLLSLSHEIFKRKPKSISGRL